jgi:Flp pilus assembly protein TadD
MSLLSDLLSKVKLETPKGGIPPTLTRVISDSHKRKATRRKLIVAASAALIIILTGLGAVYFMGALLRSFPKPSRVAMNTQRPSTAAPPSTAAAPELSSPQPTLVTSRPVEPSVPRKIQKASEPSERSVRGTTRSEGVHASGGSVVPADAVKPEVDDLLYAAQRCEAARNFEQAVHYYKRALDKDRGNYAIMSNIAGALINLGRFEEAIPYAREAAGLKADSVPALVNLGVAYAQLNDTAEGRYYLSRALTFEPSNLNALLNLALLSERIGDFAEAGKLYGSLAEMDNLQGKLGMARLAEKSGSRQDAGRIYREILTRSDVDQKTRALVAERLAALVR